VRYDGVAPNYRAGAEGQPAEVLQRQVSITVQVEIVEWYRPMTRGMYMQLRTALRDAREKLIEGGRMVIPVGDRSSQELIEVIKIKDGYRTVKHGGCRFVDLIGAHGWKE